MLPVRCLIYEMNSVWLTEYETQFEDQIELKTTLWLQIEFIIKIDFKFDL